MSQMQQIGLKLMIRKGWISIQRLITGGLAAGFHIILAEFQSKVVSSFFSLLRLSEETDGRC